jgi:hypothetical protein
MTMKRFLIAISALANITYANAQDGMTDKQFQEWQQRHQQWEATQKAEMQKRLRNLPTTQAEFDRDIERTYGPKPEFKDMAPIHAYCEYDFSRRVELYVDPAKGVVHRVGITGNLQDFPIILSNVKPRYGVRVNEFGTKQSGPEWYIHRVDFGPDSNGDLMGLTVEVRHNWYFGNQPNASGIQWQHQCVVTD